MGGRGVATAGILHTFFVLKRTRGSVPELGVLLMLVWRGVHEVRLVERGLKKKEKMLLRPDIVVLSCRRILLVDLSDTYIRFVIVETNYY